MVVVCVHYKYHSLAANGKRVNIKLYADGFSQIKKRAQDQYTTYWVDILNSESSHRARDHIANEIESKRSPQLLPPLPSHEYT